MKRVRLPSSCLKRNTIRVTKRHAKETEVKRFETCPCCKGHGSETIVTYGHEGMGRKCWLCKGFTIVSLTEAKDFNNNTLTIN